MENKKFSIKQGYVVREIAGDCIAVPVDSSCGAHIIVLNPVSKFIWEQLESEKTFDEVLKAVTDNYEVSKDEAETDLKEFLQQLEDNNILK